MASSLPEYVVLKSKYNGKYLEYVKEEGQVHGYVRFTGEDVASPFAKFQVQLEDDHSQLVHLLCCYNNKYLAASSKDPQWIVSEAGDPENDQSQSSCTLFQPIRLTGDGDDYRFKHVYSGCYAVLMRKGDADPKNNCLYPGWEDPDSGLCDVCTVIDWKSLVVLPRYVAFKGDNGNYLSATRLDGHRYLQFATSDSGDETMAHEVFPNPDGSIRFKSTYFGLFWRRSPDWIWPDSEDTSCNDIDTVFWPVKVDDNIVALRNLGNDRFCRSLSTEGKTDCLNASSKTISRDVRLQVTELVISRDIHNVEFHLDRARKYNEQVVTMGIGGASNATDDSGSLDIRVERTETKSTSWTASVSLKVGVKTTLTTKVPYIVDGEIEVSSEVTGSHQWGEGETTTNTIETVYNASVPPMTKTTVYAIGSTATCDVPFSYTQTDTYTDGRKSTYRMDDGMFKGINCFNVSYESKNEDIK